MFTPVRKDVWRWGTPDPEGNWIMYGHMILREGKCVLVDPPLVPDLIEYVQRIGKLEAVVLTTLDHTRGVNYICERTGAMPFIPDQPADAVDPCALAILKQLKDYQTYGEKKDILGMKPFRIVVEGKEGIQPKIEEFALLTENRELIVGDIAIGTEDRRVVIAPEWYPYLPPRKSYASAIREFSNVVRNSQADVLLASHGMDIYGGLQELVPHVQ